MPPWLQELIRCLNQELEPEDIVKSELQFLRLCRLGETSERSDAFHGAYYDSSVRPAVTLAADLYEDRYRKTVPLQQRREWASAIEEGFYARLRTLETDWARDFDWFSKLVSLAGFDPYTKHWTDHLTNSFQGFRMSLRRLVEEFVDQWLREQWLRR